MSKDEGGGSNGVLGMLATINCNVLEQAARLGHVEGHLESLAGEVKRLGDRMDATASVFLTDHTAIVDLQAQVADAKGIAYHADEQSKELVQQGRGGLRVLKWIAAVVGFAALLLGACYTLHQLARAYSSPAAIDQPRDASSVPTALMRR